jgi:hypothetical protein
VGLAAVLIIVTLAFAGHRDGTPSIRKVHFTNTGGESSNCLLATRLLLGNLDRPLSRGGDEF